MDIKNINAQDLQKLYNATGRLSDLKKMFKCGIVVLKNRMKELGIIRKPIIRTKVSITENELRNLCKNKTINEISKILKCDHSLISKLMKKYEIPFKQKNIKRKYSVNENFFHELNEKSMYWLGFIAADGNVCKNRLSINLSHKDISHLEMFKLDISSSSAININYTKYPKTSEKTIKTSGIRINSKKIIKQLAYLGIHPAKSLNFSMNDFIINHHLVNLFLLGLIDGDGCWSIRKNKQLSFSVCGSKKLCNQIKSIFIENKLIPNSYKYIKQQNKIWTLNISGNKRLKHLVKWLYSNATSFLLRKHIIINNHYGRMIECPWPKIS